MLVKNLQNKWVRVEQARKEFFPAFKSAWPYTVLGLSIGTVIFILQHQFTLQDPITREYKESFLLRLLEHLGVGFWVSALAVFFYEWGAHIKKTIKLTEMLVNVLTLKAQEAFDEALVTLMGEDPPGLRAKVSQLVSDLSHLQSQELWSTKGYLRVVEWMLDEVVLNNVKSFERLQGGRWQPFTVPPSAGEMADQILTAQMKGMKHGDSYDVVSDVRSWYDDGLEAFRKASSSAISQEGVVVRRIFNLFRLDLPEITESSYDEYCATTIHTLEDHLRYVEEAAKTSSRGGRYEVRVFGESELKKLLGKDKRYRDRAKGGHFGLFMQETTTGAITCFKVEEPDLSDMLLSGDAKAIERYRRLFKVMWKASTPIGMCMDHIRDSLRRHELQPVVVTAPDGNFEARK